MAAAATSAPIYAAAWLGATNSLPSFLVTIDLDFNDGPWYFLNCDMTPGHEAASQRPTDEIGGINGMEVDKPDGKRGVTINGASSPASPPIGITRPSGCAPIRIVPPIAPCGPKSVILLPHCQVPNARLQQVTGPRLLHNLTGHGALPDEDPLRPLYRV